LIARVVTTVGGIDREHQTQQLNIKPSSCVLGLYFKVALGVF
jgi:hypothetical protein